ncbi:MAG: FG-GAP-like repeat-containing protein [Actinomycetota bacterium]|nr:FG-GAP-like repeat-containing protein [Actinomycetota bacterium]
MTYTTALSSRGLPGDHVVYGPWGTWFGRTYSEVGSRLVNWTVPMSGGEVRKVHETALPAFLKVSANLAVEEASGNYYSITQAGTRVWRRISGSYRMSTHSFGTTIDINPTYNGFTQDETLDRSQYTNMPTWFVKAWTDAGFCWGGDWETVKDAMHFSWMGPTASDLSPVAAPEHFETLSNFARRVEATDTPLPPTSEDATYLFADTDRDSVSDLLELRALGNGNAEVTVLSASAKYRACSVDRWYVDQVPDESIFMIGDLEGRGFLDIWSVSGDGTDATVRVHTGSSEYRDSVAFALATPGVRQFTLGDVDLDGVVEFGLVFDDRIDWRSVSSDLATTVDTTPLPPEWSGKVLVGDRNGDLQLDVYIYREGSLDIVATGSAEIAETYTTPNAGEIAGLGDRDGDGVADLFLLSPEGSVTAYSGGTGLPLADYWFRSPLGTCDRRGSLESPDSGGDGYTELVIGVPFEDIGSRRDAGTITVFSGGFDGPDLASSVVVSQNTYGVSGVAEPGDEFGYAVQYGDFNDDGYIDVAVGAPGEGLNSRQNAGSVGLFLGQSGGFNWSADSAWNQGTSGISGAVEAGDRFGASLAAGDFDGDGHTDLAIGAPEEAIGSKLRSGMVHVLWGRGGGLTASNDWIVHQGYSVVPGTPETDDRFGEALAAGDFNGDGFDDLAVGSPREDVGALVDSGYVQVFYGSAEGLLRSGSSSIHYGNLGLSAEDMDHGLFGASLASGDVDADGIDDLVIGAPGFSGGDGAVFMLLGSSDGPVASIAARIDGGFHDNVGIASAVGDFDRDGFADIAAGSPGHESATGAVHILFGSNDPSTGQQETISQASAGVAGAAEPGDEFGSSLSFFDVNNDLFADLVIGVPGEDIGSIVDAGAVQVIFGNAERTYAYDRLFSQSAPGVAGVSETGDRFGFG